jgi:hypothetical protein
LGIAARFARTAEGVSMVADNIFPWDPPKRSVEDTLELVRNDFAYAIANTAIVVHSNNPAFAFIANTQRGQLVPRGEVKFSDGTTVELQDIGMPQPNVPYMAVQQIMSRVWKLVSELRLEIVK